ncbi:MAG: esterase/lipase family protein [Jatrophihabitans sp.]|uniref:esterase/lipase family protein n=1 Tax=Jatrophihabitans sp. TaxID=1932789 RepID=UPI003F7FCC10
MVAVLPPALLAPDTDYKPTAAALAAERRAYRDLLGVFGRRVPQPTPDAAVPVLLVPGFIAGDASLALLARHLRRQGHRTFGSSVGANLGCTDDMVERLLRRVEQLVAAEGRKFVVIGHSRGGMIAKLAAQRRPDLICGLIVLSAPVTGQLSVAAHVRKQLEWLFKLHERGFRRVISADCVTGECATRVAEELALPLADGVQYTSVYSQYDGIIDWHSCLDPDAELVEVEAGHNGMGAHPDVMRVVAERLARLTRSVAADAAA